jgi:hypothetical protein
MNAIFGNVMTIGVALIGVRDAQDPTLGEWPTRDLQADRAAVRVEAAVYADGGQAEVVEWPGVHGHRHECVFCTGRAMVDIGFCQRWQAGGNRGGDQNVDLGEDLGGEGF